MITNTSYSNIAKYYGKTTSQSFKGKEPEEKKPPEDPNAFPGLKKRDEQRKKEARLNKFLAQVLVPLTLLAWFGYNKYADATLATYQNKVDHVEMHSAGAKNLAIVEIANLLVNPRPIVIPKDIDPSDKYQTAMDVNEIIQRIYENNDDPKVQDLMRFAKKERSALRVFLKEYFNASVAVEQRTLVEDLVIKYLKTSPSDPKVAEISDKIQKVLDECKENINKIVIDGIHGVYEE